MQLTALHRLLDELMLEASDDGLEICLCSADAEPDGPADAVQTEYSLRYTRVVSSVSAARGAPTFSGGRRDPGAPSWLRSGRLTCWENEAGSVYVALVEERGIPRLMAGARPHPYETDAITLLPPGD